MATIEIHGQSVCPFAWRVRLAAHAKGVDFDWLPHDVEDPDPRVALNNPGHASPLLVHGDFHLTQTDVINAYIDEAFDGPPLQPGTPRERAQMRLDMIKSQSIYVSSKTEVTEELRAKTAQKFRKIEEALRRRGKPSGPTLLDVNLITTFGRLALKDLHPPADVEWVNAWWRDVRQSDLYQDTNPH